MNGFSQNQRWYPYKSQKGDWFFLNENKERLNEQPFDSLIPFYREQAFVQPMHAILNWKNDATSMGIRIHGDQDKVLPKQRSIDISVRNSGHFMIVTRGTEISRKIHELLRGK